MIHKIKMILVATDKNKKIIFTAKSKIYEIGFIPTSETCFQIDGNIFPWESNEFDNAISNEIFYNVNEGLFILNVWIEETGKGETYTKEEAIEDYPEWKIN